MAQNVPDTRIIAAAIDSAFNAILAEAFLCGLYTLLFGYTLMTLLRRNNKKGYAAILTLLWVLVMLTFATDWQHHRTAFVIDNDSQLDIAMDILNNTSGKPLTILDNVFSLSCNWLADALLIWRCYVLWEDNKWVLLPLPILFTAAVVLGSLSNVPRFSDTNNLEDFIFLVSFFAVSIVITFMGTSLIILRIVRVTRNSPLTVHTSAYRKIQRIVVESGILYTIAMFVTGVVLAIQVSAHKQASIPLGELATYTEAILVPFSGIGPTLIAVRIGHEAPLKTDGGTSHAGPHSHALSHLTFRRTVNNDTLDNPKESGAGSAGDWQNTDQLAVPHGSDATAQGTKAWNEDAL